MEAEGGTAAGWGISRWSRLASSQYELSSLGRYCSTYSTDGCKRSAGTRVHRTGISKGSNEKMCKIDQVLDQGGPGLA